MEKVNISLGLWSYALAGSAYGALALQLLFSGRWKTPGSSAGAALLAAVCFSSLWGWSYMAGLGSERLIFVAAGNLWDLLRYASWYGFLLLLLSPAPGRSRSVSLIWLCGIGAVLLVSGFLSQGAVSLQYGAVDRMIRWAYMNAMAEALLAIVIVEQFFRNVPADSLWNAKPLCLCLAGTFLFDLYVFSEAALFNRPDMDALSIRGAAHALLVPLLLLSTTRRSDWFTKLRVSRRAAFHSATLLISGIYLLVISSAGYYVSYFGGQWGSALQLVLIFAALVALLVVVLSGAVRAKLRVFLGKNFFRYRYDYREEWLRFTRTLSAAESPQQMGLHVIRGLADMLESPAGALWMKSASRPMFQQIARWNFPLRAEPEAADSPLIEFLEQRSWVINLREYRVKPEYYESLELPLWLTSIDLAWLVVPLKIGEKLAGFAVLANARTPMDVNWEVNDLLKTAGSQAASYLAQMSATEALLEVRKFDAFNRMSAFVVHDLKNIVSQLSLMMKNAKRLHANPEFQQDMLMTVENSLERMRQLMLQLRDGATPAGTPFGVDLAEVVRRIESVARSRGRSLETELIDTVVARGHEERVERVIGHVVQNAFDATEAHGRVWLRLDRLGDRARIQVGDTGHGMSAEFIRDRLFKPFQTTKNSGMGIGAYESFHYLRELGGDITAESEQDRGSLVTLLLPIFESHSESDIHFGGAS